jgi:tetratricopeptide (TPR) repeat protein
VGVNRSKTILFVVGGALLGSGAWVLMRAPEPQPPPDVNALLAEAQQLQRDGNPEQAVVLFQKVLEKDPQVGVALVGLGVSWQAMGYSDRAVEVLTSATKNKVGDLSLDRALARALLSTGQREKAIALLEPSYRENSDIKTTFLLADAYYLSQRFSDAIALYLELLEKKVRSTRLVLRFHRALLLHWGYPGVIQKFITPTGSLKKLIDSADLRWKGDLAGAIASVDEETPLFLRRKLHLLLEMGKYEEVLSLADQLQSKSLDAGAITYRADAGVAKVLALLLLNKRSEAEAFAELQLKELDPNVTAIRGALAAFRHVTGKIDRSTYLEEVDFEPSVSRNDHHLFLSILARAQKDKTASKAELDKAAESTWGMDYPSYLISRLQKEWD